MLETPGSGNVPSISRHPPTAITPNTYIAPWANNSATVPNSAFPGSFLDDSTENLQLSPSFRPGTGRTGISDSPDVAYYEDERRPSVTSATTISSQGSRSSISRGGFHKKLTGFFGEDLPGPDAPLHGSQTSLVTNGGRECATQPQRDRNNSVHTNNTDGRPASPGISRPRTPLPSSDVVPWVFQDPQVSSRVRVCSEAIRFAPSRGMRFGLRMQGLGPSTAIVRARYHFLQEMVDRSVKHDVTHPLSPRMYRSHEINSLLDRIV